MNKTRIIKELIGRKLEPFGFCYDRTEGQSRIFMREVKGVPRFYDPGNDVLRQYINIQENRFSKEVTVRFSTDAYGHEGEYELEGLKEYGTGTWLGYIDEATYKDRLQILAGLIIQDGFALLDKISVEEELIPDKSMAENLYLHHEELYLSFIHAHSVKAKAEGEEDIEEWYQLMKKLLMDRAEAPYEEVKELLVSMAAFIGESVCRLSAAQWFFPEYFKVPVVCGGELNFKFSPLDEVLDLWKYKCDEEKCAFHGIIIPELKRIVCASEAGMSESEKD